MDIYALTILNGIALGSVLFLVASGLSLVLGVMGILNLAHGAFYMIGAFVGWTIAVKLGWNFALAVIASGLSAGLVSLILHLSLLRRLHKQLNDQVLLTVGFIYILTNLSLWIWGGVTKATFTAPALRSSILILGWPYPIAKIVIIFIGIAVVMGLWWLQDRTRIGAIIRAGMDDKEMTMSLGINVERVSIAIFSLGGFLAGIAGIIGAQLMGAYLDMSTDILLLGIAVVVIGGMGSVQGAMLGGIFIGLADAFSKLVLPEIAMFTPYLSMIIILLVRPTGFLGKRI